MIPAISVSTRIQMTRQHWPAVGLAANANACARRPSLPLLAPRAVSFQPSVTDLQSMAVTPSTSFPLPKALLRMTASLFLPLPSISPTYLLSFLPSILLTSSSLFILHSLAFIHHPGGLCRRPLSLPLSHCNPHCWAVIASAFSSTSKLSLSTSFSLF